MESKGAGIGSTNIFMKPPPIEKTSGLTDGEWREVQARMDNPESWTPARRALHEEILSKQEEEADKLSERLRAREIEEGRGPTIYIARGGCGYGKTTAFRNGVFGGILDSDGEPSGIMAPDKLKIPLREGGKMTHSQVHDESCMLNRELGRRSREKAKEGPYSVVYDKTMSFPTDFESVFEDANETEREVAILDMDIPMELSAVRVLTRAKGGEDPNINFDGVAYAFKGNRKNRLEILAQISDHLDSVSDYKLMVFDPESKQTVEVANFDNGNVKFLPDRWELAKGSVLQSDEAIDAEVDAVKNTIITEEYINSFINKYFQDNSSPSAISTIETLNSYKGRTLGEALDMKAK